MWDFDFSPLIYGAIALGIVICLVVIGLICAVVWLFNHVQIV